MAKHSFILALAAAAAWPAAAQDSPQTVTVTGRAPPSAAVGGFDDVPLSRAPFGATVFGSSELSDAGITSMADLTRIGTSLNDAYNAAGYWSSFSVRGYRLDERQNYRRDGLPINAETALWLGNKSSIEVLRGTSGMQAGVSAPGGLVNLQVKRPNGPRRLDRAARSVSPAVERSAENLLAARPHVPPKYPPLHPEFRFLHLPPCSSSFARSR